jgi:hemerythrin-like metal-binding protein
VGAYVAWKPYYSVGDPSLDAEHQEILRLLDELYTSITAGQENAKTKDVLNRLTQYTLTHFKHEEQAMREGGFPGFAAHKAIHDRMRRRTVDLRANIGLVTGQDLLYFLKDWWTNHIQVEDKAYAPYLGVAAR